MKDSSLYLVVCMDFGKQLNTAANTACWGVWVIVVLTEARHVARGCLLYDSWVSVAGSRCDGTAVWTFQSRPFFKADYNLAGLVRNCR